MLIATEIIGTVHQHSNMTTLHEVGGGGGEGVVFCAEFWKSSQHYFLVRIID